MSKRRREQVDIPEELRFVRKFPWTTVRVKGDELDEDTTAVEEELTEPWEPTQVVHTYTPGRDGLPTVDDDLDHDPHAAPRTYDAWKTGETHVISGPVGPESTRRGKRFDTRSEARAYWEARMGPILEEYRIFRGYAYRVYSKKSN